MAHRTNSHHATQEQPVNRVERTYRPVKRRHQQEELPPGAENLIRAREKARKIKSRHPNDFEPAPLSDAVVMRTTVDAPDMRFAGNKNKYSPNPLLKVNGHPDNRFLNNRPDILQAHNEEGTARPNIVFSDDHYPEPTEDDPNAEE